MTWRERLAVLKERGGIALVLLALFGPMAFSIGADLLQEDARAPVRVGIAEKAPDPLLEGLRAIHPQAILYALTPAYNPGLKRPLSCRVADLIAEQRARLERFDQSQRRCEADTLIGGRLARNLEAIVTGGAWPVQHHSFEAREADQEAGEAFIVGPFLSAAECLESARTARRGGYLTAECRWLHGAGSEWAHPLARGG